MALLGIDLGTSAVKVLVLGEDGQTLGSGRADYPMLTPQPGWAESDPQAWWQATCAATRAAVAQAGDLPIAAIGLSGQMHGVVLADHDTQPTRRAILWADTRAGDEAVRFRELPATLRTALANPLVPGMLGPSLLWVRDHEPAAYGAARWALSPKDWLRWRLTGVAASDPSDASATLLYDIPQDGWAEEVVVALDLRRDLLPPLQPSTTITGMLTAEAAASLGLPAAIRVAVGGADTPCAALGAGLLTAGPRQLTLGTGAQIVQLVDEVPSAPAPSTHLYRTVAGARWYQMAAVQNGGLALDWVRRVLAASWDDLYASADAISPGADGLLFLPYLAPERGTAAMSAGGGGAWLGLRIDHTRAHLLHAALEGVAYGIRFALEALPDTEPVRLLRLTGGGSVAPAWRQLLADVLGCDLQTLAVTDASARGAALLAGLAIKLWPDAAATAAFAPSITEVTTPIPERAAAYQAVYARYRGAGGWALR